MIRRNILRTVVLGFLVALAGCAGLSPSPIRTVPMSEVRSRCEMSPLATEPIEQQLNAYWKLTPYIPICSVDRIKEGFGGVYIHNVKMPADAIKNRMVVISRYHGGSTNGYDFWMGDIGRYILAHEYGHAAQANAPRPDTWKAPVYPLKPASFYRTHGVTRQATLTEADADCRAGAFLAAQGWRTVPPAVERYILRYQEDTTHPDARVRLAIVKECLQ